MAKLTKTEVKQKAQDRILMVHLRQEKKHHREAVRA
jgi:hypothetical protein